ncbi:hypothetical protein NKR23_g1998 [Pleurostoma richardsiae]|uniref:Uncharacterized protein n=1 Tax=Pleurostoma richardsiae TaxID=41990 RepID=A0AA38S2Y2_9PEZI|nr:hypothetical protein NKR23_g1998 [Pleurostoma richardsiae]
MACYCANYYGSINCHNTVSRFGDRCKLCLALKSGASLTDGLLLPEAEPAGKSPLMPLAEQQPRRHHFRSGPDARGRVMLERMKK